MRRLKIFIWLVGLVTVLGVIAGVVFFFGGMFNVAASEEDPALVSWTLERIRIISIRQHATDMPPGSLDDQKLIEAGAKSFRERGCVQCHGGPGVDEAKFADGLNPSPPDLKAAPANALLPQEVFWVVKNGIRMTGMPSFGAAEVPDAEIWSIVAFVKKLPMVSESDYKAWSEAPADAAKP
jgi:mono/diheme cytochrome c family protein